MARTRPPMATCPVCGVSITVVMGMVGSHLRDHDGYRVYCPGSFSPA